MDRKLKSNDDRRTHRRLSYLLVVGALMSLLTLAAGMVLPALPVGAPATILQPNRVGGAPGDDQRAADIYPAVAYDPATRRYLAVWMTVRNAGSQSDGFDVYGVFLDSTGQPSGGEFRISDANNAARSSLPAVAAGNGEFAVAWTAKGACRIFVQRVTDSSGRGDQQLVSSSLHNHSPSLIYNPPRRRYALAFVEGDDYLPPTLFGAQTIDCGNNASSTSRVKALEFHFSGDTPLVDSRVDVSDVSSGGFRPQLAYNIGLNQYLAIWEDRRSAAGATYRFDLYAQRLDGSMSPIGGDIALATGGDYTNQDASATWTPRPAVAGGSTHFLATWFARRAAGNAAVWSVMGQLVPGSGSSGAAFPVAEMTFAENHPGNAPTGFLATVYSSAINEFLVSWTSHQESLWGYISFAEGQRVTSTGQLLRLDGSVRSRPGVGNALDTMSLDDQISVGIAANPQMGDYQIVYGKHAPRQPARDFDIWGVRMQMQGGGAYKAYLPLILRGVRR